MNPACAAAICSSPSESGDRQRQRHVEHGPLACLHPRLAHDLEAVRHRLDAGVGAAAQGIGAHQQQRHAAQAQGGEAGVKALRRLVRRNRHLGQMAEHRPADEQGVGGQEHQEDGEQGLDRLLDAAQVEGDQQADDQVLRRQLQVVQLPRQEAEDGVAAGGDRHRDGEDVVHHQGAARDHADARAEEMGGDHVAAAAGGELLDDAAVGGGNDEDGEGGGDREADRQVGVLAKGAERLLRPVGGRRQPVRSQPHPGQEGDQRHLVELGGVGDVARRPQHGPADPLRE